MKSIEEQLKFISKFHKVPAEMFYSEDNEEQFKCPKTALKIFLEYAFERAGSAVAYKYMGKQALEKTKIDFNNITKDVIDKLWENYKILSQDNNLLTIDDNGEQTYRLKQDRNLFYCNNHNDTSKKQSILDVFKNYDDKIVNMATWCCDKIINNEIKKAYSRLIKIRGIGPKIASLYLRDIAYICEIDTKRFKDSYLLQPIDTWIAQAFDIILNDKSISLNNLNTDAKRKVVQEKIHTICVEYKVSPIEFNKGAWYFGSRISRTYNRMKSALCDAQEAKKLIKDVIQFNKIETDELKELVDKF